MRKLSLLLLLFAFVQVQAQDIVKSLEQDAPNQGKVTIHQDPAIAALMNAEKAAVGNQKVIKAQGFRVQVYAGNNSRNARSEANSVSEKVKKYFPDLKVYVLFDPPRRLCQVGDFRSIEEADATMRKMKSTGAFREAFIVKAQVNIPL